MIETIKTHSATIISTIISIIFTIIVGYVGVVWSQNQFKKAEVERRDRVKKELLEIIEEHIVNQKTIKPTRLYRLIENKCSQNDVTPFKPIELIKNSESNILESKHIDFQQKEQYKTVFDSIYLNFNSILFDLEGISSDSLSFALRNPELIASLTKNIVECNTEKANKDLKNLIVTISSRQSLSSNSNSGNPNKKTGIFGLVMIFLFTNPILTIVFFTFLIFFMKKLRELLEKKIKIRENTNHNIKLYDSFKLELDNKDFGLDIETKGKVNSIFIEVYNKTIDKPMARKKTYKLLNEIQDEKIKTPYEFQTWFLKKIDSLKTV